MMFMLTKILSFFKVIYVARNPKDVLVSYFHFHKFATMLETPKDFNHFFEKFIRGDGKNIVCLCMPLIQPPLQFKHTTCRFTV